MNSLQVINELQVLYDTYSNLLTERQRNYFEDYYFDDLSLSEIADNLEVSRNAVHSNLQKTIMHLHNYEEKLGFVKKQEDLENNLKTLQDKYSISTDEIDVILGR